MASVVAFTVVKYTGAVYLMYLGIQALRSRGSSFDLTQNNGSKVSAAQAFRQGILVDILNPKVAIFFMALLPQSVRPDHGNPAIQLFGLGALVILVSIPVEAFFVIAAPRTTGFFRQNPKTSIWLERMLGTIFISLGLRLAFSEHSQFLHFC
jgi:threonine/homoserine/homoserine lactone efflux protein